MFGTRACNTKEEYDYKDYVDKHIKNVMDSYNARSREIGIVLGLTSLEQIALKDKIAVHDLSKYTDEEFEGYRQWFFTTPGEDRNKEAFDKAWKHHYTVNDHHPEYWKGKDMSKVAIGELICDWEAMSRNFGGNPLQYFEDNKEKKRKEMSPSTFSTLELVLPKLYNRYDDLKQS